MRRARAVDRAVGGTSLWSGREGSPGQTGYGVSRPACPALQTVSSRAQAWLSEHGAQTAHGLGHPRVSASQLTIPRDTIAGAGQRTGDRHQTEVRRSGKVALVLEDDPLSRFPGALTYVCPTGELGKLRCEWT